MAIYITLCSLDVGAAGENGKVPSQDSLTKMPVHSIQLFGMRKISCQVVNHPFQSSVETLHYSALGT